MSNEMNNYQYWGLVGQGVTQASSSLSSGFSGYGQGQVMAGGYNSSAAMLDVQAEQELINAEGLSNARMEQFNQSEAANVAIVSAMGKTGENTTISDANLAAAEKDVGLIKRQGRMNNIGKRSSASAARSAAKQSDIASKSAMRMGIFSAVGSLSSAAFMGSMIGGSAGNGGGTTAGAQKYDNLMSQV